MVNIGLLWSMLLLTDLTVMSPLQLVAFVGVALSVISFECVLGVVRVQDYYKAKWVLRNLEYFEVCSHWLVNKTLNNVWCVV